MVAQLTQLIPIQELTPHAVGTIRNETIEFLVNKASKETGLPREGLLVRDIRPLEDLEMYAAVGATGTTEDWTFDVTASVTGFNAINAASAVMSDQRYVALFGIRDLRHSIGSTDYDATAPGTATGGWGTEISRVSLVRISVGGSFRAIWDTRGLNAYKHSHTGFTPSAVIIPPNASYKIEYYVDRGASGRAHHQLIGVVVEPRGKVISP